VSAIDAQVRDEVAAHPRYDVIGIPGALVLRPRYDERAARGKGAQ
jgi:hypothetical protein